MHIYHILDEICNETDPMDSNENLLSMAKMFSDT